MRHESSHQRKPDPTTARRWFFLSGAAGALCQACADHPDAAGSSPSVETVNTSALVTDQLTIDLQDGATTLVSLSKLRVVDGAQQQRSKKWDLAFLGLDIHTNSGPSGPGAGGGFGPLGDVDWQAGEAPDVPFLRGDVAGGAFLDWYSYDDETHVLWSRHHIYAVDTGERRWKMQILSYYGDALGAPISALYTFRYAPASAGPQQTQLVDQLNATAGGLDGEEDSPSGCIQLASGERTQLTVQEQQERQDWDLCFRRDAVSVNGGSGGPGGVTAVDLDADEPSEQSLDDVKGLDEEEELARFNAVDQEALEDETLRFIADGPISPIGDKWLDRRSGDLKLASGAWYVVGADGQAKYWVVFSDLVETKDGHRVTIRVRPIGD